MAMTKILFTGHGGVVNRGCEAILRSSIDIIGRYVESPNYTLLSRYPGPDIVALKAEYPEMLIRPLRLGAGSRLSPKRVANAFGRRVLKNPDLVSMINRKDLGDKDVVLHIGGDNFTGGRLGHWFDEFDYARKSGAKTVIWGASIGPFTPSTEMRWAKELKKVDLITAREDLTVEYLAGLGVVDNVVRIADPAFLLSKRTYNKLPEIFRDSVLVGIGMSDLVSRGGGGPRMYLDAFADLSKMLLDRDSVKLLLVPHVIEKSSGHNDLLACHELWEKLGRDPRVHIIDESCDACEMKDAISRCDFFVGARTHSTIAALSTNVPTLSVAYSRKAYGLNLDIFGHTRYVLPAETISKKTLKDTFLQMEREKIEIVATLKRENVRLRTQADSAGKYLAEILGR